MDQTVASRLPTDRARPGISAHHFGPARGSFLLRHGRGGERDTDGRWICSKSARLTFDWSNLPTSVAFGRSRRENPFTHVEAKLLNAPIVLD